MKKSYIFILIIILMITLVIINQKKNNKTEIARTIKITARIRTI